MKPSLVRLLTLYSLLLMASSISNADAETFPFLPFTAQYSGEAKGMTFDNLGSRKLVDLGNQRYRMEYTAEAMVYKIEESSVFDWHASGPVPIQYQSKRGTLFKKRKSSMWFDWENNQINFTNKKDKGVLPLTEGIQDPLTSPLLLALAMQSDKSEIEFTEALGHKTKNRRFELIGKSRIKTQLGELPVYHLKRMHDDPNRETEIWLHEEHPYIPVKVKSVDDGDQFILELTGFTIGK